MIIKKGIVDTSREASVSKLVSEIKSLDPGKYQFFVCDYRENRTIPQNRYLWGVVYKAISDHLGYAAEDVHEICKFKFLRLTVADPETGDIIETGGSTRVLDTKNFTWYIDKVKDWAWNAFGCVIPDQNSPTNQLIVDLYSRFN